MNRPPDKHLLESDPHQLASLIGGDDEIGERIWNPDELAATITKYTGSGGVVVIPDHINNMQVTGIGEKAFFDCARGLDSRAGMRTV